jgi:hypothetical protein
MTPRRRSSAKPVEIGEVAAERGEVEPGQAVPFSPVLTSRFKA